MNSIKVAIADLIEDPKNARTHGERNLAAIRASLERFGQVEPLVVREGTNVVLGGNGRLSVMRALGWEQVTVVYFSGSDQEACALALALNRTAELADWDTDMLAGALVSLDDSALGDLGWTDVELSKLTGVVRDDTDDEKTSEESALPEATPSLEHVDEVILYFRESSRADFLRQLEQLYAPLGVDNVTDAVAAAVALICRAHGL